MGLHSSVPSLGLGSRDQGWDLAFHQVPDLHLHPIPHLLVCTQDHLLLPAPSLLPSSLQISALAMISWHNLPRGTWRSQCNSLSQPPLAHTSFTACLQHSRLAQVICIGPSEHLGLCSEYLNSFIPEGPVNSSRLESASENILPPLCLPYIAWLLRAHILYHVLEQKTCKDLKHHNKELRKVTTASIQMCFQIRF